ncbi:MAG TPA: hypothetical protein VFD47_09655, partial [Actinomycetota bacterium]|nr:hypothetical protein [Actinomycetota bacterium]
MRDVDFLATAPRALVFPERVLRGPGFLEDPRGVFFAVLFTGVFLAAVFLPVVFFAVFFGLVFLDVLLVFLA